MTRAEIEAAIESNNATIAKAQAFLDGTNNEPNWTKEGARRTVAGAEACNRNLRALQPDDEPESQDQPVDWDVVENAMDLWGEGNNRGEGFAVGPTSGDVRSLNNRLGRLVWDAPYGGGPVVYLAADGTYTAVCDVYGPWAVVIKKGEEKTK